MTRKWPERIDKSFLSKNTEENFKLVQDIITSIRKLRSENKIEPARKIKAIVASENKLELIKSQAEIIKSLARLENLEIRWKFTEKRNIISAALPGTDVYIPLEGLIDVEKEKKICEKKLTKPKSI